MQTSGPLLGPVHFVVMSLDSDKLKGRIKQELERASASGVIRVLDALAIQKNASGAITTLAGSDLTPDERYVYGALLGALMGFGATGTGEGAQMGADMGAETFATHNFGLTAKDIQAIAADVPNGTTALMVLFEHRWALPLKDAVLSANGVMLAQGIVQPEDLIALGSQLALAENTAEQIEQAVH
jgi:uncharacterized membrane protein